MKKNKQLLRISCALLILAAALSLCSCKQDFRSNDKTVLLKIGSGEINCDTFNYFFASYKRDDETLTDEEATALALDAIGEICAVRDLAAKYSLELSSDEKKDLRSQVKAFRDTFDSDEEYFAELAINNISEQVYYDILCYYQLKEDVFNYLTDEYTGDIPSDDKTVSEFIHSDFMAAAQILICNDAEEEEDDPEENRALANELRERISAGEDFFALAAEYTEDEDRASYTTGYYFTRGMMIGFFEDEVEKLAVGEISDVVESYLGYHIIYRLPLDEEYIESHFDSLREAFLARKVNDRIEELKDSYEVEYLSAYYVYLAKQK